MAIQRIYWDASVFHALFGRETDRVDKCERVVRAAENDAIQIYTSSITYTECIWLKGKDKLDRSHDEIIRRFFEHKFIRPMACDRPIGEEARILCWTYQSLKPKDAIHLASALFAKVDAMHSYDDDDLVCLNGKLGDPPLRICHPGEENDFTLKAT